MSRSVRKHPFRGHTAESDKQGKRLANRRFRRAARQVLKRREGPWRFRALREVSNVDNMEKDDKFRFDPEKKPRLMRK